MPQSTRLALPLLAAGQAQKDVTHNEALLRLDRLVALAVVSRAAAGPSLDPVVGDCHIVAPAAAAAWGQPAGTLMHWQGNGWLPESPVDGQIVLVQDEAIMLLYRAGWQPQLPVAGLIVNGQPMLQGVPAGIANPAGGTIIDTEARTTLAALITALQAHGLLA
jgi:hypothetical protein